MIMITLAKSALYRCSGVATKKDRSFSFGVENIHTNIQDNPQIFRDREFWAGFPTQQGNREKFQKTDKDYRLILHQMTYVHTKFQDNQTKFQDFGI